MNWPSALTQLRWSTQFREIPVDGVVAMLERMITTDMSANIIKHLLKQRWSLKRIAHTIGAPVDFVNRVQAKLQVLTLQDIKQLAKRTGQTPQLMIFNSIRDVQPGLEPLFASTRQLLEASAGFQSATRTKPARKRRRSTRAA
jgi:hypothetical protein